MADPLVTRFRAAAHEALYLRLATLLRQVEAVAMRRPSSAIPAETRAAAEALLFDAQRFAEPPRHGSRRDLPRAADSFAGLATQLGQAQARLDAFESAHADWHPALKCFVWRTDGAEPLPVRRLRPATAAPLVERDDGDIRRKLMRRIDAKVAEAYDRGFHDGSGGRRPG